MKLAIAWNVWNNYEDLLLGSEIVRLQNEEFSVFDSLHIISQGGYPEPPSNDQSLYIDQHFSISINIDHRFIQQHTKFRAMFRVLKGAQHAFQYASQQGCDYALVTPADSWCLDIRKMADLLEDPVVKHSAWSARIGLVTGLDLCWGSYVPWFDDHFMILNIPLCEKYGVFDYDEPRAHDPHFFDFGSIHYVWNALIDERVPQGLFNPYTHMEDCVNHFGEKSGLGLLPWQYQPKYNFLHANCFEEPNLHSLRAELLSFKGLDRYPAVLEYCKQFKSDSRQFLKSDEYVFYRQTWMEKARVAAHWLPRRLYWKALKQLKYQTYVQVKGELNAGFDPIKYYDLYEDVLPYSLTSRRRPPKSI